ncbi:RagB/SusD family nutrient uptake outer membrane protein [Neolewinella agarilytica]|uniref:Starch-binding associating with outer membrane n=1 Tax=Neolewinella agarilytica TaxID=478744 RepID=A0A1H9D6G1_9BACT|nr:RagB/SusD family nutrient uptake outer membrane protein [Neolewinella agarilytica]SEQ09045.1 Starch-binding associating with outer membrane [Neolewinella agarilytica]
MKNSFYLTILLLFVSFTSCESFLEEDPRDIISPTNFFNSESDARAAVTGIYAILKNNAIYGQVGLDAWYENGADVIGPNRGWGIIASICSYTMNEGNAGDIQQLMGIAQTWKDLNKIVLNTNVILDNVENNENIPAAARGEIVGEALFLRSLAFYHLTNLWGDVPYYRENLSIDEIGSLGRTDKDLIRDEILVDLQEAQNLMLDVIPANENGRASKWVAAMVMAKIYLIQENWQAARDKSLEIINDSPYEMLADYGEVFSPFNEYNSEIIWELDFAKDITSVLDEPFAGAAFAGNANWRASIFSPRIRDEPLNSGERGTLRDILASRGEAMNGTGLQIPLPDLVNKFPLNDLRRPHNIITNYQGVELKFPYMPKLWNLDLATSPRFNHSDNRIVFRLSDVYLMAAEAENELNGPENAYQYINEVRKRAYATQEEWELTGLSQVEFRNALRDERKWELAGEGHRRMDLIRWGILLDVVRSTEYRVYNPAENIQPYHVLLPIPTEELNLNPALLTSDPTNNGYR